MSSEQLTEGVIGSMLASTDGTTPVVPKCQILSLKKLQTTSASANVSERYRVVLSDGVHYTQAMLATQLKPLVENGMLDKNVVVRITQFTSNTVQNRKILILLNLEPISSALPHRIGNPQNIEASSSKPEAKPQSADSKPAVPSAAPQASRPAPSVAAQALSGLSLIHIGRCRGRG